MRCPLYRCSLVPQNAAISSLRSTSAIITSIAVGSSSESVETVPQGGVQRVTDGDREAIQKQISQEGSGTDRWSQRQDIRDIRWTAARARDGVRSSKRQAEERCGEYSQDPLHPIEQRPAPERHGDQEHETEEPRPQPPCRTLAARPSLHDAGFTFPATDRLPTSADSPDRARRPDLAWHP
jgi:hypothetical protein